MFAKTTIWIAGILSLVLAGPGFSQASDLTVSTVEINGNPGLLIEFFMPACNEHDLRYVTLNSSLIITGAPSNPELGYRIAVVNYGDFLEGGDLLGATANAYWVKSSVEFRADVSQCFAEYGDSDKYSVLIIDCFVDDFVSGMELSVNKSGGGPSISSHFSLMPELENHFEAQPVQGSGDLLLDLNSIPGPIKCSPNPFNPAVTIEFSSGEFLSPNSTLAVYDVRGREVFRFSSDEGGGRVIWRGVDTKGRSVPSGIYLVCQICGEGKIVGSSKITLLR